MPPASARGGWPPGGSRWGKLQGRTGDGAWFKSRSPLHFINHLHVRCLAFIGRFIMIPDRVDAGNRKEWPLDETMSAHLTLKLVAQSSRPRSPTLRRLLGSFMASLMWRRFSHRAHWVKLPAPPCSWRARTFNLSGPSSFVGPVMPSPRCRLRSSPVPLWRVLPAIMPRESRWLHYSGVKRRESASGSEWSSRDGMWTPPRSLRHCPRNAGGTWDGAAGVYEAGLSPHSTEAGEQPVGLCQVLGRQRDLPEADATVEMGEGLHILTAMRPLPCRESGKF